MKLNHKEIFSPMLSWSCFLLQLLQYLMVTHPKKVELDKFSLAPRAHSMLQLQCPK